MRIVPGRRVEIEIRDVSSPIMVTGGPIAKFEIGLVDYEVMCRLDFESYTITDPRVDAQEALTAALAHYQATLLEFGVVGDWLDRVRARKSRPEGAQPQRPAARSETPYTPTAAAGTA